MNEEQLALLLQVSEEALASALGGAWEDLEVLELRQESYARSVFSCLDSCTPDQQEIVIRIVELINQTVELVDKRKLQISDELRFMKKSGKGNQAYLQNSL
jgi:hypothetical protein